MVPQYAGYAQYPTGYPQQASSPSQVDPNASPSAAQAYPLPETAHSPNSIQYSNAQPVQGGHYIITTNQAHPYNPYPQQIITTDSYGGIKEETDENGQPIERQDVNQSHDSVGHQMTHYQSVGIDPGTMLYTVPTPYQYVVPDGIAHVATSQDGVHQEPQMSSTLEGYDNQVPTGNIPPTDGTSSPAVSSHTGGYGDQSHLENGGSPSQLDCDNQYNQSLASSESFSNSVESATTLHPIN